MIGNGCRLRKGSRREGPPRRLEGREVDLSQEERLPPIARGKIDA